MNDTAATEKIYDGETTTSLERQNQQISDRQELTPDDLRLQIARQKELREIMTEYVRSEMREGHHWYSFNKLGKAGNLNIKADKPALTQDGAHLICGLFKITPGPVKTEFIRHEDGHFTVVAEACFYNLEGAQIATGNGSCSTRESKYAYRWVSENNIPKDIDGSTLKTRSGKDWKTGREWIQYRLENDDLADLENTVLKMACKRASVAGVRKFPLVSELFAADPTPENNNPEKPHTQSRKTTGQSTKNQPKGESSPAPKSQNGLVKTAADLSGRLVELGVEQEELAMQFLPVGVASFTDLSEEQAFDVIPVMAELLNLKLKEKKKLNTGSQPPLVK